MKKKWNGKIWKICVKCAICIHLKLHSFNPERGTETLGDIQNMGIFLMFSRIFPYEFLFESLIKINKPAHNERIGNSPQPHLGFLDLFAGDEAPVSDEESGWKQVA
eukprot:TRINITY_DN694_c0_g1_i3.p1 TRINITY_DN694_c0_g1~~TRINITY_DN694_c0_g1_i3.p1  ORF type:complete len:106 (+),score=0.86 TRINITY_DN694_c0_g1_i3:28-345(+)